MVSDGLDSEKLDEHLEDMEEMDEVHQTLKMPKDLEGHDGDRQVQHGWLMMKMLTMKREKRSRRRARTPRRIQRTTYLPWLERIRK